MLNNKLKMILVAIGVGSFGFAVSQRIALAGISRSSVAQASLQNGAAVVYQQKQALKVAMGHGKEENAAEEQRESAKLQPLAKITAQAAQRSAEAAQGGRASSVQLENDNGSLVYAVVVGQTEVKVDAGDGRILYTESAQEGGEEESEGNHPKGSIRLSAATGDGDGETNDDG